jgi:hypothetical protein
LRPGQIVRLPPHDRGVELLKQCAEVDRRIVDDPVVPTIRIGDEAVEADRHLIAKTFWHSE